MRLLSELRNIAMSRMGKNGKEKKGMQEGWVEEEERGASLCCPICILLCKNITSDLHY